MAIRTPYLTLVDLHRPTPKFRVGLGYWEDKTMKHDSHLLPSLLLALTVAGGMLLAYAHHVR